MTPRVWPEQLKGGAPDRDGGTTTRGAAWLGGSGVEFRAWLV